MIIHLQSVSFQWMNRTGDRYGATLWVNAFLTSIEIDRQAAAKLIALGAVEAVTRSHRGKPMYTRWNFPPSNQKAVWTANTIPQLLYNLLHPTHQAAIDSAKVVQSADLFTVVVQRPVAQRQEVIA